MICKKYLTILVIFIYSFGFCINSTDSLKQILPKLNGTQKIEVLIKLGSILRSEKPKEAETYFLTAINELKKSPNEIQLYKTKIGLGKVWLKIEKREAALQLLEEVLKETTQKNNPEYCAEAANQLAKFYTERDPDKSIAYTLISEKAASGTKNYSQLANVFNFRGQAYFSKANYKKASECFENSRQNYLLDKDESGVTGMTMNLGIIYYKMNDFNKSLENYKKSYLRFKSLKDTKNMTHALTNIGITQKDIGQIKNAKKSLIEAGHYYAILKDSSNIAMCLENLALTEYELDNRPLALELLFKSLAIREKTAASESDLIIGYDNICSMLTDIRQIDQARFYYSRANLLAKKIGNTDREARTYYHYSQILSEENKMDSAIYYQLKALGLNQINNDEGSISGNCSTLGNFYFKLKNYNEAQKWYSKALELKLKIGDRLNLSDAEGNVGNVYFEIKNYKKALEYFFAALKTQEETGIRKEMHNIYSSLAKCYYELGNVKEAYKFHIIYSRIKDSIYNLDINKQLAEMSEKFESEKKEKEIALLKKDGEVKNLELRSKAEDIQKQKLIIIISFGGLLLFVILSVIIFRALKQNQKARKEIFFQKELIEVKQKEIVDSITYAKRIQSAIIPTLNYVKQALPESFVFYRPKDIVAGDFYWMDVRKDNVLIAAADCTGHGVPGAMVSVVCSNALNQSVKEFGITEPGKILDKTRELVLDTFSKSDEDVKDGMDISLIKIEPIKEKKLPQGKLIIPKGQTLADVMDLKQKFKIEWAGANNPLWYFSNKELIEIKAHKQAIGKTYEEKPFPVHTFELSKGDTFYLFTDGFIDQFGGPEGKKFKGSNFKNLLTNISHHSMEKQNELISKAFEDWKGNLEQVDDVCVIGVRL